MKKNTKKTKTKKNNLNFNKKLKLHSQTLMKIQLL
jgi:hypothetical protein